MLRRLLLLLLLASAVPTAARAERLYAWIENADIPSSSTSVAGSIVTNTNYGHRFLGFRDGAGTDSTLRRARIPVTILSDWGNTFDVRIWYTVGGHCAADSAHCWDSFNASTGCASNFCITENGGGTCVWKVYLDAYPNGADLTAGPSGSGGSVTGAPSSYPLTFMHVTNMASGIPIKNQAAGGASCSGTACRGAYGLLTLELDSASTSYEYCDVRAVELRGN